MIDNMTAGPASSGARPRGAAIAEAGPMTELFDLAVKELRLNDGFTAFDLNVDGAAPWPFRSRYHRFTAPDGSDPHDHPFALDVSILVGGYVEEVFEILPGGGWRSALVTRLPGTSHRIEARTIHRIVRLLEPECWTHVITGPGEGDWRIWRFDDRGVWSRPWQEADFVPLSPAALSLARGEQQ